MGGPQKIAPKYTKWLSFIAAWHNNGADLKIARWKPYNITKISVELDEGATAAYSEENGQPLEHIFSSSIWSLYVATNKLVPMWFAIYIYLR